VTELVFGHLICQHSHVGPSNLASLQKSPTSWQSPHTDWLVRADLPMVEML